VRASLACSRKGRIEVVAGVGDAEALEMAVEREQPDLAIVDARMPPTQRDEGLRAAIEIRRRWPQVALLVLSQFVEERYANELLSAETRAVGYLLKERVSDVDEFLDTVQRVAAGGTALDSEVVRQLLARSRRSDPLSRLTPKRARGARPDGRG
jgi:DNA-binding NarL/FixJ family response regulator